MSEIKQTFEITVTTQRGTNTDARRVMKELIERLNETDWVYASVGEIKVKAKQVTVTTTPTRPGPKRKGGIHHPGP